VTKDEAIGYADEVLVRTGQLVSVRVVLDTVVVRTGSFTGVELRNDRIQDRIRQVGTIVVTTGPFTSDRYERRHYWTVHDNESTGVGTNVAITGPFTTRPVLA
jgi:hypothetical protein